MRFTIYRNKWRNSHHGKGQTKLLNKEGYQCCLGFCALQLGVPIHQLLNMGSPNDLLRIHNTFDINRVLTQNIEVNRFSIFDNRNNVLSIKAIRINDNSGIALAEKEASLIGLFKEFGHELEFVGEYEVDT